MRGFCSVDVDDFVAEADAVALDALGDFNLDDADFVVEADSSDFSHLLVCV